MSLRRSLSFVLWAWGFGAVWMYITNGAVTTEYARLLGLSPFGFGILAALPFAAALAQLPTSYLLEAVGRRKPIFVISGIIHRAVWFALAAVPWVLPQTMWVPALLIGTAVAMLAANVATPAWMSWAGDLVPRRVRGRYFSRRIQLGEAIGLMVTIAVGIVLDQYRNADPSTLQMVISVAFLIAATAGVADFAMHAAVPSPAERQRQPVSIRKLFLEPLKDRDFRRFLGFTATMTFAMGYIGQFAHLYMLEVVTVNSTKPYLTTNIMLVGIPLLVMVVALPIWGRVMDRIGRKPVMLITGILVVNGASAWIFVTEDRWRVGYAIVLVATFAWAGLQLANFNMILGLSEQRWQQARTAARRKGRPSREAPPGGTAYVAINSVVVAVAGSASGIFAGCVAAWFGPYWRGDFFGWSLTYHGVLFLISAGLRAVALVWLFGLNDPGAYTTRQAARYMVTNIYSNVQQALFAPARTVTRVSGGVWSRLLYRPGRKGGVNGMNGNNGVNGVNGVDGNNGGNR